MVTLDSEALLPNKILYGFYYNSMTEESAFALVSLHESKGNAEKALEQHKADRLIEYEDYKDRILKELGEGYPIRDFGQWESWVVWEVEVLP